MKMVVMGLQNFYQEIYKNVFTLVAENGEALNPTVEKWADGQEVYIVEGDDGKRYRVSFENDRYFVQAPVLDGFIGNFGALDFCRAYDLYLSLLRKVNKYYSLKIDRGIAEINSLLKDKLRVNTL